MTSDQLPLPGTGARRRKPTAPVPLAEHLPVATVVIDSPVPHLDRPFDYGVPAALAQTAQPGVRVRVRFSGRLVDGWLVARAEQSDYRLVPLHAVVSAEPEIGRAHV